jgi:ribonuclease BN (tRNA processing enzyme)
MQQPFFPVTAEMIFRAQVDYHSFEAGDRVRLGPVTVSAIEANHPGGCLSYRVQHKGKTVVYATDTEHGERDDQMIEFARGADVLIYDAMYTDAEYLGRVGSPKVGWGHSSWENAVRIANESEAKVLVLFHHEPSRTDDDLDALLKQIRKARKNTFHAREGAIIRL